jgi:hypothetical protein
MDRADRLAAIAVELVGRVRDDEPAAVHRWLQAVVADNDMMALAVILAAAVPDDRPWSELVAWIEPPESRDDRRRRQLRDAKRRQRARPQPSTDACGQEVA